MKNKSGDSAPAAPTPPPAEEFAGGAEPSAIPDDAVIAGEQPAPPDELDGAVPSAPGERPKFEGDWQCSVCGGAITSLPFQPRSTDNLKCLDCFKQSKQ